MMLSNLNELENDLKKIPNNCHTKLEPNLHNCQNCRYRHKGICDEYFGQKSVNSQNIVKNLEEGVDIMTSSRLDAPEPILNLENLFYEIKVEDIIAQLPEVIQLKAKYANFKLLTDIQNVLQNCRHLTNKDKLYYCTTQRYFMKLYLREINKPE
ncbi:MAG: hypothetical protein KGD58_15490 [Candidatus Lokiarchaeota archaeon]|nr:hypothetical protein [Candidatus Lokiarchaeota archaeon]